MKRLRPQLSSRTTTVGLVAGNYVILAADKRATGGFTVYHKRVKKILRVADHIAMTISGLVADAQIIGDYAKMLSTTYEHETGKKIKVASLANSLSLLLSTYLRYSPFIVQLLVGGFDVAPSLYYLDLYGSVSHERFSATGSGSPIAYGVLESEYRENMSPEEAKRLAVRAISSALERDGFSGEGVDVVIIGPGHFSEETIFFGKALKPSSDVR